MTVKVKGIIAVRPDYKIDQLKIVRKFGMVLKKLNILDQLSDPVTKKMYPGVNRDHYWFNEFTKRFPVGFSLSECKDYVERLYEQGILPKGTNEQQ